MRRLFRRTHRSFKTILSWWKRGWSLSRSIYRALSRTRERCYYAVGTVIGGFYVEVKPVNSDGIGRNAVIRGYNNGANDARRYQPPGRISAKGSRRSPSSSPTPNERIRGSTHSLTIYTALNVLDLPRVRTLKSYLDSSANIKLSQNRLYLWISIFQGY